MIRSAILCLALTGCTQLNATQSRIGTFAKDDVANALAVAQAAGPAGAEIVPCLTFIQSQLTAPQAPQTAPGTIGLATAFVEADLALGKVSTAINPAAQSSFETACGPIWLHLANQGLSVSTQIGLLAGMMAK